MRNILYLVVLSLLLVACQENGRDFEGIQKSGVLRILTKNSPTTYYEDRDGKISGLEYEMGRRFAESLGLEPQFIVLNSIGEILEDLRLGKGDIAAAGLAQTESRQEDFAFSPAYQTVQQMVVCREGLKLQKIANLKDLRLVIEDETSYEERLIQLKQTHPDLQWTTHPEFSTAQIFEQIDKGKIDCTVADSHIVTIHRRYFPEIEVGMALGEPQELAWALRSESTDLRSATEAWFESSMTLKQRKGLVERFYSHVEDFDAYDIKKFVERIDSRLPKYKPLFKKAAKEYGWDWTFLAAVAYQESHWDPAAVSATGVRGIMMLTKNTAKSVGVKDREDPQQSIFGGAKYLSRMRRRIPNYIPEPDRTWLTLASYNVGFSHMRDARGVAAWKDHNPNRWSGVRQALPLLSNKQIYQRLPHGYARGHEPVLYVRRIRNYHDLLKRYL